MMSFIVWRALSSAAYNIKMSHSAVIINEKINAARASVMNDRSKKGNAWLFKSCHATVWR